MNIWNNVSKFSDETDHVNKFVFTASNAIAEAVLYRYPDYKTRTVICCSTMSGCPIGCRFCGSGDYFVRNLTSEEIIDQINTCIDNIDCKVEEINKLQIMFMSMGEPMLNYKNLEIAIIKLNKLYPKAALLISTSAPNVDYSPLIKLSKKITNIGLQFSIHESNDIERNKLIPFKNKLKLTDIAMVGENWFNETKRKPFINYCAHDKNSDQNNANDLMNIFNPNIFNATVSVVCERSEGLPATNDYQRQLAINFSEKLINNGFDVRVFDPAGQDTIGGGCGQLWFLQKWMKNNPQYAKPTIGNGKKVIHVPKN